MKMKKLAVLTLGVVLTISTLSGCAKTSENNTSSDTNKAQTQQGTPQGGRPMGGGLGGQSLDTSKYTNKYLDITYANKSQSEKLDIYLPNEGNDHFQ